MDIKDRVPISPHVLDHVNDSHAAYLRQTARAFYDRAPLEHAQWHYDGLSFGVRHATKLVALIQREAERLGLRLTLTSFGATYRVSAQGPAASLARFVDYLSSMASMLEDLERS